MDYRKYAKQLLANKKQLESAYQSIGEEILSLESERRACKAAALARPAEYEESRERIVNIISRVEDCRLRRSVVERELSLISKGMCNLDTYQRRLIDCFFVERDPSQAEKLSEEFYRERSQLYRDRNKALEKFTLSVYGVIKL